MSEAFSSSWDSSSGSRSRSQAFPWAASTPSKDTKDMDYPCALCGLVLKSREEAMDHYANRCPSRIAACQKCGLRMPRKGLEAHAASCGLQERQAPHVNMAASAPVPARRQADREPEPAPAPASSPLITVAILVTAIALGILLLTIRPPGIRSTVQKSSPHIPQAEPPRSKPAPRPAPEEPSQSRRDREREEEMALLLAEVSRTHEDLNLVRSRAARLANQAPPVTVQPHSNMGRPLKTLQYVLCPKEVSLMPTCVWDAKVGVYTHHLLEDATNTLTVRDDPVMRYVNEAGNKTAALVADGRFFALDYISEARTTPTLFGHWRDELRVLDWSRKARTVRLAFNEVEGNTLEIKYLDWEGAKGMMKVS